MIWPASYNVTGRNKVSARAAKWLACTLPVLLVTHPSETAAEVTLTSGTRAVDTISEAAVVDIGVAAGSAIALPIPLSDPTLGVGLTLVGGYLFQLDAGSETSFVGIGLLGTDGGSEAAAVTANLSFGDGRWSVAATYAQAALEYSLPGLPDLNFGALNIRQSGDVGKLRVLYNVTDTFSVGLDTLWLRTDLTSDTLKGALPPVLPDFELEVEDLLVGPSLEWNTVDNKLYPTSGTAARLTWQSGSATALSGGFKSTYNRAVVDTKTYLPLGDQGIVALRGTVCSASAGTPFYNLCGIGVTDGLRGFAFGEALGRSLSSVQGEYRHRLGERFGVTVFAGAGLVASNFGDLADGSARHAGGIGLRYRVSKRFPVDFSVDQAINDAGDSSTYIYIGQAF